MNSMEAIFFWGSLVALVGIAIILIVYAVTLARESRSKGAEAGKSVRQLLVFLMWLVFALLTGVIITRWVDVGHGPFSSMFEFAIAFSWGIIGLGLLYWMRYKVMLVSGTSSLIALALMIYASFLSKDASQLVPALQQSFLLSTHVASAALAYGAFAIGFITSIMYLLQGKRKIAWMPSPERLDRISYNTVIVGFPLLTLVIILGSLWAEVAWGSYWSWDPQETAALVTWFFYAAYLHTRVVIGWQGKRSAVLLIVAFLAVVFTFFGNYFFSGLHAFETGG
jgi:cytochrome c-type biogenesis protein CcsB